MTKADWQEIAGRFDQIARDGRQVRLWLRDDDAVAPTPALDRLINLMERFTVPALLAVIPEPATPQLAKRIADVSLIQPCQHGFNHGNHAPEGARACELGADRPLSIVLGDLLRGQDRLQQLFGRTLRPVLVPPWNRVAAGLPSHLPTLGFHAISTFGRMPLGTGPGLKEVNAHIDIMNWREGRVGRDHADLLGKLAVEIEIALLRDEPIGLLAHHLVHDETAWGFLEALFEVTAAHPAVSWASIDEFL